TRPLRRLGMTLAVTTLVAALLSIGLYYRHFTEAYAHALSRVRVSEPAPESQTPSVDAPAVLVRPLAWHERASDSVKQTTANFGWPVILLAAVGAWHVWRRQWRAPVPLLLAAWCVAWLAFLFVGTLTRVDTQYQRYAAEFVGRVNLASYPAAAVLGGIGAAAMIRTWPRIWSWCGIALLTAA